MDLQHQQLIHMINQLEEALQNGKGGYVLLQVLEGLLYYYTTTHFAAEERLMRDVDFSGYKRH
jgi:hemerythrin